MELTEAAKYGRPSHVSPLLRPFAHSAAKMGVPTRVPMVCAIIMTLISRPESSSSSVETADDLTKERMNTEVAEPDP